MRTSTFTTQATLWDWYSVVDPGGVQLDASVGRTEQPFPPPLVGNEYPWKAVIFPEQKWAESILIVEVHDSPPPAQSGYTRTAEVELEVLSGEVVITQWGGEPIHRLNLTPGPWRLRVYARDPTIKDDLIEEMEEHLVQFWPLARASV